MLTTRVCSVYSRGVMSSMTASGSEKLMHVKLEIRMRYLLSAAKSLVLEHLSRCVSMVINVVVSVSRAAGVPHRCQCGLFVRQQAASENGSAHERRRCAQVGGGDTSWVETNVE